MAFRLLFTDEAQANLAGLELKASAAKRLTAVRKALGWLERNPRYPGLRTHPYSSLRGPQGEKVFEAYAENRTSAAFRIFWTYSLKEGQLTIIAITSHP